MKKIQEGVLVSWAVLSKLVERRPPLLPVNYPLVVGVVTLFHPCCVPGLAHCAWRWRLHTWMDHPPRLNSEQRHCMPARARTL